MYTCIPPKHNGISTNKCLGYTGYALFSNDKGLNNIKHNILDFDHGVVVGGSGQGHDQTQYNYIGTLFMTIWFDKSDNRRQIDGTIFK